MINVSFNKGIFLDFLKVANVIPVHKKREKLDPNIYIPISLLSNISKLYEKAMYIWLTSILRKNKVLLSFQFGFQNYYSTNHAFISLTEMTRNALDNGKFDSGVFIDLQKTFDTVNHNIKLFFRSIARLWFLFIVSNEDTNMWAKKATTFLYFPFLISFSQYILVEI